MNRIACLFAAASLAASASAQTTYGLRQGMLPWQEGLYLGGYDVLSNTWVLGDTLDYAVGFGLGSSTFDNQEEAYVFLGTPSISSGLVWMSQAIDGPHTTAPLTGNLHSIHHDMQSGVFYGLEGVPTDSVFVDFGDGTGFWNYVNWGTRVVAIDPQPSGVVRTAVVEMPWLEGVVAGASCFDSDLHRFYIWGITNSGTSKLITVDCEAAEIVSNVNVTATPSGNLSEFEYNIADGKLIGLRSVVDLAGNADMDLITVDPMTGNVTSQLDLPQVSSYTPDGTVFDQLNRLYILHYYQGVGTSSRILAVDVSTWEIVADHALNANFLELEMSNADFATLRYGVVDVAPLQVGGIELVNGEWINRSEHAFTVSRFDLAGRVCSDQVLQPGAALGVPNGHWLWQFSSPGQAFSRQTFRQ